MSSLWGEEMAGSRLSVVVITKNEQENIRGCLETVRWADEIIVVDAESSDETVSHARDYTPHIFVRPWPGFGPQKNFGMEKVAGDWILLIDADERVPPELREEILRMAQESPPEVTAYRIPRRNYFYGKWVRWGGAYPDYQIRLLRKGAGRYNDVAVHENLLITGSVGTLHQPLDHWTERTIADHFKKFDLYTTLASEERAKTRKTVWWGDFVFNPLATFFKMYMAKQGFREGIHGLILSVLASYYTFAKYTKLWEMTSLVKRP